MRLSMSVFPGHLAAVRRPQAAFCAQKFRKLGLSNIPVTQGGHRLQPLQGHTKLGRGRLVISAAIFGVGAPEALLVGVVALVVFGPKGLAQAVKSLGATLKTFSPTLKELANVTNDLSSTLQEQIGLDDIRNEFRSSSPSSYRSSSSWTSTESPTSSSPAKQADSSVKKLEDEDLQAKIEESKRMAWGDSSPSSRPHTSTQSSNSPGDKAANTHQSEAKQGQPPAVMAATPSPKASDFSIEELEAELKRRREAGK